MPNLMKGSFLSALPWVLQEDAHLSALAEAVAIELAGQIEGAEAARIYPAIDSLPEELLDILAEDYKIDWYNFDYPLETKRNLVKSHWYVHRYMGTTGAVRTAVQAVYPHSDVEEWWQDWYEDGEPYHFRIILEASAPIVPVTNTDITREVELYKSFRSHLDGVVYRSTANLIIKTRCQWIIYSGRFCGTYPVIARQGSIEGHSIVVRTRAQGLGHSVPRSGSIFAGTYPRSARMGGLEDILIVVRTADGGLAYQNPVTGEVVSGTYPAPSEPGQITEGMVVIRTADGQVIYQNPATGEIITGEFPDVASQGSVGSGTITASSEGQGASYNGVLCGGGLKFYQ